MGSGWDGRVWLNRAAALNFGWLPFDVICKSVKVCLHAQLATLSGWLLTGDHIGCDHCCVMCWVCQETNHVL